MPELDRWEVDGQLTRLDLPKEQIKRLGREIRQRVKADPVAEELETIPGVEPFIALLLVAEIGHLMRFPSPKHLARYTGLAPSLYAVKRHFVCKRTPIDRGDENSSDIPWSGPRKLGSDRLRFLLGKFPATLTSVALWRDAPAAIRRKSAYDSSPSPAAAQPKPNKVMSFFGLNSTSSTIDGLRMCITLTVFGPPFG